MPMTRKQRDTLGTRIRASRRLDAIERGIFIAAIIFGVCAFVYLLVAPFYFPIFN
jgi:hypothetical protein